MDQQAFEMIRGSIRVVRDQQGYVVHRQAVGAMSTLSTPPGPWVPSAGFNTPVEMFTSKWLEGLIEKFGVCGIAAQSFVRPVDVNAGVPLEQSDGPAAKAFMDLHCLLTFEDMGTTTVQQAPVSDFFPADDDKYIAFPVSPTDQFSIRLAYQDPPAFGGANGFVLDEDSPPVTYIHSDILYGIDLALYLGFAMSGMPAPRAPLSKLSKYVG